MSNIIPEYPVKLVDETEDGRLDRILILLSELTTKVDRIEKELISRAVTSEIPFEPTKIRSRILTSDGVRRLLENRTEQLKRVERELNAKA